MPRAYGFIVNQCFCGEYSTRPSVFLFLISLCLSFFVSLFCSLFHTCTRWEDRVMFLKIQSFFFNILVKMRHWGWCHPNDWPSFTLIEKNINIEEYHKLPPVKYDSKSVLEALNTLKEIYHHIHTNKFLIIARLIRWFYNAALYIHDINECILQPGQVRFRVVLFSPPHGFIWRQ